MSLSCRFLCDRDSIWSDLFWLERKEGDAHLLKGIGCVRHHDTYFKRRRHLWTRISHCSHPAHWRILLNGGICALGLCLWHKLNHLFWMAPPKPFQMIYFCFIPMGKRKWGIKKNTLFSCLLLLSSSVNTEDICFGIAGLKDIFKIWQVQYLPEISVTHFILCLVPLAIISSLPSNILNL